MANYSKLSEKKKVEALEKLILIGTDDEMLTLLEAVEHFEFTGRAMVFACLHKGFERVKLLFEHGCNLNFDLEDRQVSKYEISDDDYLGLFLSNDFLVKYPEGTCRRDQCQYEFISDEEFEKCLLYLVENQCVGINVSELIYYSAIYGRHGLARQLISKGYGITSEMADSLAGEGKKFYLGRYEIVLKEDVAEHLTNMLNIISNCMESFGKKIKLPIVMDMVTTPQFYDKNVLEVLLSVCQYDYEDWYFYISECVCNDRYELLEIIIDKIPETRQYIKALSVALGIELTFVGDCDISNLYSDQTDYEYEVYDNTITINNIKHGKRFYAIPESIDGKTVTEIAGVVFGEWGMRKERYLNGPLEITVSKSVEKINSHAFSGLNSLVSVKFYGDDVFFEDGIFEKCEHLVRVELPGNIKSLGSSIFSECKNLKSINIPNSVEIIPGNSFAKCWNLSSVKVSNDLKSIEEQAFLDCKKLNAFELPNGLETIGDKAFYNSGIKGNFIVTAGLSNIGQSAFYGCTEFSLSGFEDNFTGIILHSALPLIDLEQIVLPINTAAVHVYAFGKNAPEIVIPGINTEIWGGAAYYSQDNIKFVVVPHSKAHEECVKHNLNFRLSSEESGYDVGIGCREKGTLMSDDFEIVGTVLIKYHGDDEEVVIPEGITEIEPHAFQYFGVKKHIKRVFIPSTVETIQQATFMLNDTIEYISLAEGIKCIERQAFEGMKELKEIVIPNSVTELGERAFYECRALEKVVLGDGLDLINSAMFVRCISLKEIVWGKNITSIDTYAFCRCDSLEAVVIPEKVECIESYAFSSCKSLKAVKLNDGLKVIGDRCFISCNALESIVVPKSVELYGENSFSDKTRVIAEDEA